jgi:glycosyltransferase involved in cell wall biosynthesis
MDILFVTPRFLPDTGGVELHVAEVARRLAAAGDEVTVLTTDLTGRRAPEEERDGYRIVRVRGYPKGRDYHIAPGLPRRVASLRPDVVHVQSFHTAVAPLAMIGALAARIPYVVTFHGGGHSSRLRTAARGPQLSVLRPLLARAAALVAVAEFEVEHYGRMLGIPPERFGLIPNGADLPAVALEDNGEPREALVASVGRLERYKGHQHVIAALPAVLRRRPDARLWIAGSGGYEGDLRALAERLGVHDKVEIRSVPPDERTRMARELGSAAVVVLASEFETHPIAAIEAAALGCRVVVADSPGLRDLAARGIARLAEHVQDPEALAEVVLEELDRPPEALRLHLPTWDDCARGLRELYESVAGK